MSPEHEQSPDPAAAAPPPEWAQRRTAFGRQADAYASGRPGYPRAALEWVLPPGAAVVLDLAAGTGRLSELLLDMGLDVLAVEPLDEMRAHVPARVNALAGTAEAIPLADCCVDAVVVGQAFHWFDVPRAMAEIRRVLRPGGTIGLLWNFLDDTEPWVDELARLVQAEERASYLDATPPPPYADLPGLAAPVNRRFPHAERYDVDRLVAFAHSRSHTILLNEPDRLALVEQVRALAPAGQFRLPLVCHVWRGEKAR